MASTFKTFGSDDQTVTATNLHEVIPITGTIVSGTYSPGNIDNNIKNYSHGMFQSTYDYPYLSSSANHLFDITVGYSTNSSLSGAAAIQNSKKINIYNQFAKILVQPDVTGSIQEFDQDGDISGGGTKMKECFFMPFSRLLVKDEIKKDSTTFSIYTGSTYATPDSALTITDYNAQNDYKVNSPAGEYGLLYTSSADITINSAVGHIYYQAGIVVLTASIFDTVPGTSKFGSTDEDVDAILTGSSITGSTDGLRNRVNNLQFNNTTELNSSIYFCRAAANEYNYSSNSTYLSGSQIVMKNSRTDTPASYVTSIGLYSSDNVLLATAKLSEPLKKDPTNELTLRVRLDY
jgi:hypothetical protein